MNETLDFIIMRKNIDLKVGEPNRSVRLTFGRTTEGTLGRWSSTMANCARRSVGGGVLFNFNKLAVFTYYKLRAKSFATKDKG